MAICVVIDHECSYGIEAGVLRDGGAVGEAVRADGAEREAGDVGRRGLCAEGELGGELHGRGGGCDGRGRYGVEFHVAVGFVVAKLRGHRGCDDRFWPK